MPLILGSLSDGVNNSGWRKITSQSIIVCINEEIANTMKITPNFCCGIFF